MTCGNCGKEDVIRVKTFFYKGQKIERCKHCIREGEIQSRQGLQIRGDLYGIGTAAHWNDISNRRLAPDNKTVYYDTGKKHFTMT